VPRAGTSVDVSAFNETIGSRLVAVIKRGPATGKRHTDTPARVLENTSSA
jgi:hypothetical protein